MSMNSRTERARKRAIIRRLPDLNEILRASLVARYTTCGKPGCKCMRGERHGPSYVASVTVAPGKTRQVYVRKGDVDAVRTWIDNYDKLWRGLMEISDVNFELLRTMHRDRSGQRRLKPGSK